MVIAAYRMGLSGLILLPFAIAEQPLIQQWLSERREKRVALLVPQPLVGSLAGPHIRFRYEPEVLEHRQRPIDRRDINEGIVLANPIADRGGGQVAVSMAERREDHHPLRRCLMASTTEDLNSLSFAAQVASFCK